VRAKAAGSFKDTAQFWWIRNGERAGLVLVALILLTVLLLARPLGRPTSLTGVVTAIHIDDRKNHPAFNAWIDLGGNRILVGLSTGHECNIGSPITILKTRTAFGPRYIAANDCHAPPSPRQ
jgi:hypothetical protein